MSTVAVVAHAGKSFGGGLVAFRRELERRGVSDPIWCEIPKSKRAPHQMERALAAGADPIFVWGGDGTVQRCIDAAAGSSAALAIVPAGTANVLATNLEIPQEIEAAVEIGLHGDRRRLDVGRFGKERFAAMAGAGFDAAMIRGAGGELKDRFGRLAYVYAGSKSLRTKRFHTKIAIDGTSWFRGDASCILIGNVSNLFGGIEVFEGASPDDGRLDIGVVTADGVAEWARTLARTAAGRAASSPFVQTTTARTIRVKLDRKVLYELDGGDRTKIKSFKVEIEPKAVTICVPRSS
ncbi:MAG TPA: diacylglycerol kinase family protein [Gaiellaceae bacterium]|nr:diacylglycerol kinase family protein [Gaiellaceae bacterium]